MVDDASGPGLDRLKNQHVVGSRSRRPVEVVAHLGAMQAQDYGQALWAVGVRTKDCTLVDVERSLEQAAIVRTWPMRGTIHLVAAQELRWRLELSATRVLAADARRQAQLELDAEVLRRCQQLTVAAIRPVGRLTRAELMSVFEQAGIATTGQRGYHILWHMSQSGLTCLGPMQGKQQTVVLLADWVPAQPAPTREEALGELALSYFTSHGPATVRDLAWWAGITLTDARAGLADVRSRLSSEGSGSAERWGPTGARTRRQPTERMQLLPGFDEFLLGYQDRSAVLAKEHAHRIVPGNNGIFRPTLVLDAQVVGTWQRIRRASSVDVSVTPFEPLGEATPLLEPLARRYAQFLGLPLGRLDVGPGTNQETS